MEEQHKTAGWDDITSVHDEGQEFQEGRELQENPDAGDAEPTDPMNPMNTLEDVAGRVRSCTSCPLHAGRTNAVPGEGPEDAGIMFIAEGPGANEDEQGRPFVGQAGYFLDDLLAIAGMNRSDVFITNMIKCRAPGNRDPEKSEMDACSKYLDRQIEIINPKLIVTLGRFSLGKFIPGETITKARGRVRRRSGLNIFPIMHPAAGLRRKENKETVIQDFLALPETLRELAEHTPEEEPDAPPKAKKKAENGGQNGSPNGGENGDQNGGQNKQTSMF